MVGIIVLVIGVLIFTRNAFRLEKISRWEAILIPVYSLVMGIQTLTRERPPVVLVMVTVVVGLLAAGLQAVGAQLQVTDDCDRHGRPVVKLRRGWWYLLGWVLIFAYGIGMAMLLGEHVNLMHEVELEIMKDLFSFRNFTTVASWNIYLQSGIASLGYTWLLIRREPTVRQAVRHKKR
ncbi:MAG: hydrophobic protein [Lactobacillus sp.]|nr:hydrophobic protein [Lactobacillus sp.]MCI2033751.1 hydrophobic protein [Lactobacillus sp.]